LKKINQFSSTPRNKPRIIIAYIKNVRNIAYTKDGRTSVKLKTLMHEDVDSLNAIVKENPEILSNGLLGVIPEYNEF